jgi:TIR domain
VKIFVSYRREDSQHVVSKLCDRLDDAFGPQNVFFDERSVGTGGDFLGQVGGSIYMSDAILVVIGRNWATIRDAKGRLRLSDPDDPVRWEVGLALASRRVLIPLLVDQARMPAKGDLPRELRDITTRSGVRLETGAGFDASVDDLIQRLGGPTTHAATQFPGTRAPRRTAAWTTFEGNWQTQDGGMTQITQEGNLVELHGSGANGVVYEGRGYIEGRHAALDFANSFGVRGRLVLELVSNGAYINGQLQTPTGIAPFVMMRRT